MRQKELFVPLQERRIYDPKVNKHQWRLGILFEGLERGMKADEAYAFLASSDFRTPEIQIGHKRETFVKGILITVPSVMSVQRFRKGSREDRIGLDLGVDFGDEYLINRMYVQVKGSQKKIKEHRRMLRQRYELSEDEFHTWQMENKLILLSTDKVSAEQIQHEFETQAREIDNYWRGRDADLFDQEAA